jgi:hypothetical protein
LSEETWDIDLTADAEELVNKDLPDILQEAAPYCCYFGAIEGDGSDFGFWPSSEMIQNAIDEEELVKVSDLSEIPEGWNQYVLVENDHGNWTMYGPKLTWDNLW